MERKPYTQSVIAKLMGLEEMPHQQPVQTRKRVLSENYLRKTASIGLREKRPIKESHSFSTNTEKEQTFKVVLGMSEMCKKENEKIQQSKALNEVREDLNSDKEALFRHFLQIGNVVTKSDLKFPIISRSNRNQRKTEKTIASGNILRSRQKLDNGFATEPYEDHRLPTKIVILKPKPVKVKSDVKASLFLSSQSENSKQKFSSPINSKENSREKEIVTPKSRPRNRFYSWNVSNSEVRVDETSPEVNMSSNYSNFVRKAKERLSDRWKMTKVAQEVGTVSCRATLSEMLSVPDLEVGPKTLINKLDEMAPKTGNIELGCTSLISSNEGYLEENYTSINSDFNTSSGKESHIRSHEYVVDYSNCMSSGEAYQPSPNSVLEPPFKEDFSPVSQCYETVSTDLQGLWMELQLLKSDSEKTISEGTGMNVSSDGDASEKSFHSSGKNSKLMKFLRESESKDFSYIRDILEESGLHSGTTIITFDSWHSPECLLAPSVFEALEKKYADDTYWNKTERKLLFDRVNAGLMEILKPWLNVHIHEKPLRKKVGNALKRDLIEEELWSLLVSETEEVKKELSEKAVGRESWVEFWDEVETIAIDIEKFLFGELVEDLFSI